MEPSLVDLEEIECRSFLRWKRRGGISLDPLLMLSLALSIAVAAPLRAQSPQPGLPNVNDHGTFEISAAGKTLGTETFSIRTRAGRIEAEG